MGGSFDPPHRGHIAIARAAQSALALDRVLFAPVAAQPLKPAGSTASFEHRVAMTRLAIAGEPNFELSLADAPIDAPGSTPNHTPNYTFDTLSALRATLPPAAELFCLLGADSLVNLRLWHRSAELPFAATLIVAARPGEPIGNIAALLPAGLTLDAPPAPISEAVSAPAGIDLRRAILRNASGNTAPFYLLPGLHLDISASAIRRQIHAAQPTDQASGQAPDLAPAVLHYIAAHGLYGLTS
ncbi:MAG TPA: nicotinate (nicotinamide) nucleotide adenylyltransferase [Terracidiphilus sp.]|nr:nicotinate (nicotinamide) nucleotide adenylyltransferase [Terracidiphilus sp.]